MMESINKAKLSGYKFLIEMGRKTIDDIPEPYRQAIIDEQNQQQP